MQAGRKRDILTQFLVNLILGAAIDGKRLNPSLQPFSHFIIPILDQTGWTHHYGLVYFRFTVWTLPEKGPHQSNTLQGLPQSHLICHDAAMTPWNTPTGHTFPQELYSL